VVEQEVGANEVMDLRQGFKFAVEGLGGGTGGGGE